MTLGVAVLILGPLAIPLVWSHQRLTLLMKIAITVTLIFGTLLMIQVSSHLVSQTQSQLKELNQLLHP